MKLKSLLQELSYSNSIKVSVHDYFDVTFIDIDLEMNHDIYGDSMNKIYKLIDKYGDYKVARFSNINDAVYSITIKR